MRNFYNNHPMMKSSIKSGLTYTHWNHPHTVTSYITLFGTDHFIHSQKTVYEALHTTTLLHHKTLFHLQTDKTLSPSPDFLATYSHKYWWKWNMRGYHTNTVTNINVIIFNKHQMIPECQINQ